MARMRRALTAALVLAGIASAPPARADAVDKEVCLASYASGQRLMRATRLRDARKDLQVCADETCPAVLKRDCKTWLGEVDARMPSVVIAAREAGGASIAAGEVVIDDAPAALGGGPYELDPGAHVVRLVRPGRPDIEATVVLKEGEKARRIDLVERAAPVVPPAPPTPAPRARPIPWAAIASAGVAVVAAGSFAFFGLSGRAEQADALDPCRGHCSESAIDAVRTKYVIADVSLAISVVAASVATVLFLTR
jgi:hypothetical protein